MKDTYFTIGVLGKITPRNRFEVLAMARFSIEILPDGSLRGLTGTRFFPSSEMAQRRVDDHKRIRMSYTN